MRKALLMLLCAACGAASGAPVSAWRQTLSPHFLVLHEASLLPNGFTMDLERMHNRLRTELAIFAPWMANERIKLYFYKAGASYLGGEFKPAKWSNGFSDFQKRMLVTHEQETPKKTAAVIAHETTHLLLKSYWGERSREPPAWLNEGLAMVQEAPDPQTAQRSEWHQALGLLTPQSIVPLVDFLPVIPARDLRDKDAIAFWYVQAYSLVYFLLRKHSKMQFFTFCRSMRDGEPIDKALWQAYRLRDLRAFEAEWKAWLRLPEAQGGFSAVAARPRAPAAPAPARAGTWKLKEVGFDPISFHGLVPEERRR